MVDPHSRTNMHYTPFNGMDSYPGWEQYEGSVIAWSNRGTTVFQRGYLAAVTSVSEGSYELIGFGAPNNIAPNI